MVISGTLLHLFICYPILLNDILHAMICLVNTDFISTLNNVNVEEL